MATQGSRHSERQGWFDQASIEGAGVQQGYVRPSQAPPLQLPDPQPVEHGCVVELHQMTVLNEELASQTNPRFVSPPGFSSPRKLVFASCDGGTSVLTKNYLQKILGGAVNYWACSSPSLGGEGMSIPSGSGS